MNRSLLAFFCLVPMLVCCQRNPEVPEDDSKTKAEVTINGDKEFHLGCEKGSFTFSFTSSKDWTVTSDDEWLQFDPESGKASGNPATVTVNYTRNPYTSERDTYIVITGGDAKGLVNVFQAGDPFAGAAPELKSGDEVLANSPLVEKFLTEVDYPDKTYKEYTKVFDYYGGFDGTNLTWDNWETEWPDGDKPQSYSIRWKKEDMEDGKMMLHLEDELAWQGDLEIKAGARYVNITNLVPNDKYKYSVTTAKGKVLAQGNFSTTGSLHQVFFHGKVQKRGGVELKGSGARNARDLGGWTTLDGKKIKYRKVYRGGRLNEKWSPYPLDAQGQQEVLFEGIGAQLDLRGNSDVMFDPAVEGLDHCAPVIEQGGKTMLVDDAAKTKECFEFVVNSVRKGKPVYFHCSLGRDRTGTLDILLLGLLGVREGVIAKEYEVTYFAPVGHSVSSSDTSFGYCLINNLRPNAKYHFEVRNGSQSITSGDFETYGSLHQLTFKPGNTTGVRNVRDLGGWKTKDGLKTVKYRKIYRGGRPDRISRTGIQEAKREGIRAELDLRGTSDHLSASPFEDAEFLSPVIEEGYTQMLRDDKEKTRQCMQFIMDKVAEGKPVYFHCSLGRDRTGTISMLTLGVLGVDEGEISKEYELTQFAPYGYSVSSGESSRMTRMVDYKGAANFIWSNYAKDGSFEDGVQAYLLEIGISQKDIDDFRKNMLTGK